MRAVVAGTSCPYYSGPRACVSHRRPPKGMTGPSGLLSCSLAKRQWVGVPGLLLKARRQRKGLPQQAHPVTDDMCDRVGRSAE